MGSPGDDDTGALMSDGGGSGGFHSHAAAAAHTHLHHHGFENGHVLMDGGLGLCSPDPIVGMGYNGGRMHNRSGSTGHLPRMDHQGYLSSSLSTAALNQQQQQQQQHMGGCHQHPGGPIIGGGGSVTRY